MRAALQRLEQRLDQLAQQFADRALLRRAVEEALGLPEVAPSLREYAAAVEQHRAADGLVHYSAVVVLMYSAFEQFVEETIIEFVQTLNRMVPTFQQLPESVRAQHTDFSTTLLRARATRKYENRVREVEVLQNLLSCAQGGAGYRLNAMAFAQHSANLRVGLLSDMFSQVDVAGVTAKVRQSPEFAEIAAQRTGVEIENQPDSVVFRDLDDLAERRNDVAHGEVANILNDAELAAMLDYIRSVARALVGVLEENALRREIEFHGTRLPDPIAVYDNRIVCFADSPTDLQKGSRLAVLNGDGKATSGPILDIQVKGASRELMPAHAGEAFGISVEFHVKQNWVFYALPGVVTG